MPRPEDGYRPRPRRILVLAPHPFLQERGTPLAVRGIVEFLVGEGHQVDVLTFHEGEPVEIRGCTVHRIWAIPGTSGIRPGFSFKKVACDVALFATSVRLMRESRYHLVHAVEESVFIAQALRRLFGTPFVYDMDSSLTQQLQERWGWLRALGRPMEATERRAMRSATGVVTVCRALEERVQEFAPDTILGRVEDQSLLGPREDEGPIDIPDSWTDLVVYVGNLEPYQGIDLLLEGFRLATAERPDLRLAIIGGVGRTEAEYRQRVDDMGLSDSVVLLGSRPTVELGSYLRRADILASTRLKGVNTPMKIYSYMDSGTAILATDLPTHTQVLDDEVACLVDTNPESVATGLVALARDPELRARLARAAEARYRGEYGPEAFERKLRAFYDRVFEKIESNGSRA